MRRGVDEVVTDVRSSLRRTPDPSRIEHPRRIEVEAGAEVRRPVAVRVEDRRALGEERPFLGEECFELREIEDGRIDFDLTEIGIDCSRQRQIR